MSVLSLSLSHLLPALQHWLEVEVYHCGVCTWSDQFETALQSYVWLQLRRGVRSVMDSLEGVSSTVLVFVSKACHVVTDADFRRSMCCMFVIKRQLLIVSP